LAGRSDGAPQCVKIPSHGVKSKSKEDFDKVRNRNKSCREFFCFDIKVIDVENLLKIINYHE
jgi:hypothetical protein